MEIKEIAEEFGFQVSSYWRFPAGGFCVILTKNGKQTTIIEQTADHLRQKLASIQENENAS